MSWRREYRIRQRKGHGPEKNLLCCNFTAQPWARKKLFWLKIVGWRILNLKLSIPDLKVATQKLVFTIKTSFWIAISIRAWSLNNHFLWILLWPTILPLMSFIKICFTLRILLIVYIVVNHNQWFGERCRIVCGSMTAKSQYFRAQKFLDFFGFIASVIFDLRFFEFVMQTFRYKNNDITENKKNESKNSKTKK